MTEEILGWEDVELIFNENDNSCILKFNVIGEEPSKEELIILVLESVRAIINEDGLDLNDMIEILDSVKNSRVLN